MRRDHLFSPPQGSGEPWGHCGIPTGNVLRSCVGWQLRFGTTRGVGLVPVCSGGEDRARGNAGTHIFSLVRLGAAPFFLSPSVQPGGRGQGHPFPEGAAEGLPDSDPSPDTGWVSLRYTCRGGRRQAGGLACDSCQSFIRLEHV